MSRIGRMPIEIPAGVTFKLENGVAVVKGPKGELTENIASTIELDQEGNTLYVKRPDDKKENRALHGLTRALVFNMVKGVTDGFERTLEIVGVGYKAAKNGKKLVLNMGYSHPVEIEESQGITFDVPSPNSIIVRGISKQRVGQVAADVRAVRPPEPYKGKGIRYQGEIVRRKVGKSGM